jgi:glucose-1-phosphate adenylyltransferase
MRANDVLGIIYSNAYEQAVRELTIERTIASVPFGCRYRLVDFPLSNMVNCGMTEVGIITKSNYQSLMDHVGTGKPWDLARKREGMFILPPFNNASAVGAHEDRISSLYSILDFLRHARHEYVLLSDANSVYNFDFNDLLDFHTKKDADITIVYKHGKLPKLEDTMAFSMDSTSRITEVSISPRTDKQEVDFSFNIILMRKSLLEYLITSSFSHNCTSFERDVIQSNVSSLKIFGYEADGFCEMIDSLQTYYDVNMSLLNPENRRMLFKMKSPITTKICDNVPATYGLDSKVGNSLVADGCIINGTVENSILFRGVYVEAGAVIRNSIIMQGTSINRGSSLDHVITDKNVIITSNKTLSGDASYPMYIGKKILV